MDTNDRRIKNAKSLLETGQIDSFLQLSSTMTITLLQEIFAKQSPKSHRLMKRNIQNPRLFTIADLITLARAIDCDPTLTVQLALKDALDQEANTDQVTENKD